MRSATARKTPPSKRAVMMRLRRPSLTTLVLSSLARAPGQQLLLRETETPLAAGEKTQRRFELGHIEPRPQHRAEIQLGIRRMPQEEIADSLLAARADHEV